MTKLNSSIYSPNPVIPISSPHPIEFENTAAKTQLSADLTPPTIEIVIDDDSIDAMKCLNMLGKYASSLQSVRSEDHVGSCYLLFTMCVLACTRRKGGFAP